MSTCPYCGGELTRIGTTVKRRPLCRCLGCGLKIETEEEIEARAKGKVKHKKGDRPYSTAPES